MPAVSSRRACSPAVCTSCLMLCCGCMTVCAGICWDQWFPEAARAMALLGAEVIFYPTAIGSEPADDQLDSRKHWTRVMQGHSAANIVSSGLSACISLLSVHPLLVVSRLRLSRVSSLVHPSCCLKGSALLAYCRFQWWHPTGLGRKLLKRSTAQAPSPSTGIRSSQVGASIGLILSPVAFLHRPLNCPSMSDTCHSPMLKTYSDSLWRLAHLCHGTTHQLQGPRGSYWSKRMMPRRLCLYSR